MRCTIQFIFGIFLMLAACAPAHGQSDDAQAAEASASDVENVEAEIRQLINEANQVSIGAKYRHELLDKAYRLSQELDGEDPPKHQVFLDAFEELFTRSFTENVGYRTYIDYWIGNRYRVADYEGALRLTDGILQIYGEAFARYDGPVRTSSARYIPINKNHVRKLKADSLARLGRWEEAEAVFAKVVAEARNLVPKSGYKGELVEALISHGTVLNVVGKREESERAALEALQLSRSQAKSKLPAALNNYASLLASFDRSDEATELYEEGLKLVPSGVRDRITLLDSYGRLLRNIGKTTEAEPVLAEALEAQLAMSDAKIIPYTFSLMHDYGVVLTDLRRNREAEVTLAEALKLRREVLGGRNLATLDTMNRYGNTLLYLGRYDDAERIYGETLQLRREVSGLRHQETLSVLYNYIKVLIHLDRSAEAVELASELSYLSREVNGDQHWQTFNASDVFGSALSAAGRKEEARPVLAETLKLRRKVLGEKHFRTLDTLETYGKLMFDLGRTTEAEKLLAEALELRKENDSANSVDTRVVLANYAESLVANGKAVQGEALMAESVHAYRSQKGDRHPTTLRQIIRYGRILKSIGRHRDALALIGEVIEANRLRAIELADGGLRDSSQRDRELSKRQDIEKLFLDVLWENYNPLPVHRAGFQNDAYIALQNASAGSTSRAVAEAAALRFAADKDLQEIVEERQELQLRWAAIEKELVKLQASGISVKSRQMTLQVKLEAAEARVQEIDARLMMEAPQYFAILKQGAIEIEDLLAVLEENEAILFLVPTAWGTHSMAIDHRGIKWARADEIDSDELARLIPDFRSGLEVDAASGGLPLFDLGAANQLYTDLIAPVEARLEGKKIVYVIADGPLSRLPLGTLVTKKAEGDNFTDDEETLRGLPWLADRYALVQLPSLQSLIYIRNFGTDHKAAKTSVKSGGGFIGFGAPILEGKGRLRGARSGTLDAMDAVELLSNGETASGVALMDPASLRKLTALPGTETELRQVRKALGAPEEALFLADRMTETSIRSIDLSRTRILHLATHGFTSEESGVRAEPGLVFTPPVEAKLDNDGYLAASEVVRLDLTMAEWVILSACNTASPSGKSGETGLSGLAQAFFYAGAQSLLVSHWPVFDDIAPILTVEALKGSQAGDSRAEALQTAMRKIRNDPKLEAAHPAVWAPFALVGEGR